MIPEVRSGYKSPDREMTEARRGPGTAKFSAIPEGKRVFQFSHATYRLQLTAPEEQKRSDGTVHRDRALVVVATEHFLTLNIATDAEGKPVNARDIDIAKRLDEHPDNRANGGTDFWDYATVLAEKKAERVKSAAELLADPTQRAEIIEALKAMGAESFSLPARGPSKSASTNVES